MKYRLLSADSLEVTTGSSEETKRLGFVIGEAAYPGLTILLHGGLGMGKTTLVQGIGLALGIERIKSPSFIIVSEHNGRLPLAHADLYRLENCDETETLDFESYPDDGYLLVIEWAERWRSPVTTDRFDIYIEADGENQQRRTIRVMAADKRSEAVLASFLSRLGEMSQ